MNSRWENFNDLDIELLEVLPHAQNPMVQRGLGRAVVGASQERGKC